MFVAEEPGPLDEVEHFRRALAGAETNVATGLARLGHSAGWIGRVGDDPFGRFVLTALASTGIDTAAVTLDSDAPTGFQLKTHADGGDPEVVYFRRNSAGSRLRLAPGDGAYIGGARHLHVTGIPLALSASARDFAFRAVRGGPRRGRHGLLRPEPAAVLWASHQEMVDVINEMAALADMVLPGLERGAGAASARKDPDGDRPRSTWSGRVQRDRSRTGRRAPARHTAEGRSTSTSSRCRSSTPSAPGTVSPPA